MDKDKVLKYATLGLWSAVVLTLVAATVVEKALGTAAVHGLIYGSVWFVALWSVSAICSVCFIFKSRLYRRPAAFLIHCSFALILVGALLSFLFSEKGSLHLREGESAVCFELSGGGQASLPFSIALEDFVVDRYSGTSTASDYRSTVRIEIAGADPELAQVSMNRILNRSSYRFCQTGYDSDGLGADFAVSHDPWGIGVTYAGYVLLLLSILLYCVSDRHFRALFRKAFAPMALLLCFGLPAGASSPSPKSLPRDVAEEFGELYVCYHGRICPLQTVAHDFRTKLYGSSGLQGYTDEQVLTGWMFYHSSWKDVPMHRRRSAGDAAGKSAAVAALYSGELLKIYPCRDSLGAVSWYSQGDRLPSGIPDDEWLFVRKSWDYIFELVMNKDYDALSASLGKIRQYQTKVAGDTLPSGFRLRAERFYNSFPPVFPIAGFSLLAGVLLLAFYVSCELRSVSFGVRARGSAMVIGGVLFLLISLMLASGWIAGGHVPLSNGPETMASIAWTALLFGLAVGWRFSILQAFSLVVAGLSLAVCGMGSANPAITQLVPVLSSPLLSLHVSVIMLSYTIFALMMINGVAALCIGAGKSDGRRLEMTARMADISHALLLPGVFCLAVGIFVGAVWANVSWGTYWSWDPKETWALITLLVYAAGIHTSSLRCFASPAKFHLFTVLAFLSVLVTYFGVNFFLGGLHGYAG